MLYFWEMAHCAPSAVARLESVTSIIPSETALHCIEIHDTEGLAWCIIPEGVDDDDTHAVSARWLDTISRYCSPEVRAPLARKALPKKVIC